MKKITENKPRDINIIKKTREIVNGKYFIPFLVIVLSFLHFVLCNLIFEIRYETVDDFIIMKIISALDGNYSFYGVHIHPVICLITMFLYKTGININWYTVVILSVGVFSNIIIGTIMIKKNFKYGIFLYSLILYSVYTYILVKLNYTSIAASALLAGIISIIYSEKHSKKYLIIGLIFTTIGIMLRFQTIIIILPFYLVHILYDIYYRRNYKEIKSGLYIFFIVLLVYVSNAFIYNINPIYRQYRKFNQVRTYLFDSNVVSYDDNKEVFEKIGWDYNDWKLLYTYSYADEEFYTTQNLVKLKNNLRLDKDYYLVKIILSFFNFNGILVKKYIFLFSILVCIVFINMLNKMNTKYKIKSLLYSVLFIILGLGLCYSKPAFRVVVSLYLTTITFLVYNLIECTEFKIENKILKLLSILILSILLIFNSKKIYDEFAKYRHENFSIDKEIINYTNDNKDNAYVYPNILRNVSLSYSVYEKLQDGTFSNLRSIGDWDIYDGEYYKFKERYNLDNIIKDLYQKDNLYLIDGSVASTDNKEEHNHINIIIEYIKKHYNVKVNYKIVKDFSPYNAKIYKLYEEKE